MFAASARLAGHGPEDAPAAPGADGPSAPGGWFRATLRIDDEHEIPFFLWLPGDDEQDAIIRNGAEDIPVAFDRDGGRIVLDFPHYDSRIEATSDGAGLRGTWRKQRREGVAEMAFAAMPARRHDALHRFLQIPLLIPGETEEAEPPGSAAAFRLAVEFAESGPAVAVLNRVKPSLARRTQDGGMGYVTPVAGTIQTTTGDYRFLSGSRWVFVGADGEPGFGLWRLSVFDGAHAFLIQLPEMRGHLLEGDFYSGNWFHETFTARPLAEDEAYELPDPFSEVALTATDGRLHIPALDSPRYHNKPVIVQIFGTWCPNCHDETPALVDLYDRYHGAGLEILGLAYEVTGDDARSRRQVERFRARYGVPWEIVIAGTSDKDQASATLPDLSRVKSFPTTIWIDQDGLVRAIHSGFSGPATGEAHAALLAEFDRLTRQIVQPE
ncbi:MAG: TlpA family protein disulfide reductase [Planctomycetota bacterium]|nr:MAG: TlpA family protein disulfide reductase [Planctomycetota bacterium]